MWPLSNVEFKHHPYGQEDVEGSQDEEDILIPQWSVWNSDDIDAGTGSVSTGSVSTGSAATEIMGEII